MRVLIAGMGSAVGAGIALALEKVPEVTAIAGFDLEPPRRWIRRGEFQFAEPGDSHRVDRIVADFKPTVVIHAWVFEPRSRSSPGQARARTVAGTESLLGAITKIDSVERVVVRSGASIYGRGRTSPGVVGVKTPTRPTSAFGEMLARVESRCAEAADSLGAGFQPVRFATVMASNLPTPLGRYLRLGIVPVPITTNRFGVVHLNDASRVLAASALSSTTAPINVVAGDPVTPFEAITIGQRVPLPVLPFVIRAGRFLAELPGTPLPEHVIELLTRGQVIVPTDLPETLGVSLARTTRETIADLYAAGRLIDIEGMYNGARVV